MSTWSYFCVALLFSSFTFFFPPHSLFLPLRGSQLKPESGRFAWPSPSPQGLLFVTCWVPSWSVGPVLCWKSQDEAKTGQATGTAPLDTWQSRLKPWWTRMNSTARVAQGLQNPLLGYIKKILTNYHNSEQVNRVCEDSDFFINYNKVHKLHIIYSSKYNENIIMYNNISIIPFFLSKVFWANVCNFCYFQEETFHLIIACSSYPLVRCYLNS